MKRFLWLAVFCLTVVSCRPSAVTLQEEGWAPRVREALDCLLADCGKCSPDYDASVRPYAVFDFDNTTIINDIAQTLLVYQIENRRFAIAPEDFYTVLTESLPDLDMDFGNGLTPRMLAEDLARDYAFLCTCTDLEEMRQSGQYLDFRAKLWYYSSSTDLAFPESPFGCVWIISMLEGMTRAEVTALTRESVDFWMSQPSMWRERWDSPDGNVSVTVPKGLAFTPEMKELYAALRSSGIDVYVCSASFETIVEAVACTPEYGLNLDESCVFGIRPAPTGDEYFKAVADSSYAQPYRTGKVECILSQMAPAHGGHGPVLVAGDSNGDYAMLTQFPDLKVGLIIECLRSGSIGELAEAARNDKSEVTLSGRTAPLYVVQGRNPETKTFISTDRSLPVKVL